LFRLPCSRTRQLAKLNGRGLYQRLSPRIPYILEWKNARGKLNEEERMYLNALHVFKKLDKNNKGYLTLLDLDRLAKPLWMRHYGKESSTVAEMYELLDRFVSQIETNELGLIQYDDFKVWYLTNMDEHKLDSSADCIVDVASAIPNTIKEPMKELVVDNDVNQGCIKSDIEEDEPLETMIIPPSTSDENDNMSAEKPQIELTVATVDTALLNTMNEDIKEYSEDSEHTEEEEELEEIGEGAVLEEEKKKDFIVDEYETDLEALMSPVRKLRPSPIKRQRSYFEESIDKNKPHQITVKHGYKVYLETELREMSRLYWKSFFTKSEKPTPSELDDISTKLMIELNIDMDGTVEFEKFRKWYKGLQKPAPEVSDFPSTPQDSFEKQVSNRRHSKVILPTVIEVRKGPKIYLTIEVIQLAKAMLKKKYGIDKPTSERLKEAVSEVRQTLGVGTASQVAYERYKIWWSGLNNGLNGRQKKSDNDKLEDFICSTEETDGLDPNNIGRQRVEQPSPVRSESQSLFDGFAEADVDRVPEQVNPMFYGESASSDYLRRSSLSRLTGNRSMLSPGVRAMSDRRAVRNPPTDFYL